VLKKGSILLIIALIPLFGAAQSQDSTINFDKRKKLLKYGSAAAYSISMVGLKQLWYNDFEQSSFHTVNDNNQWLQLDKIGHAYSSYSLGIFAIEAMRWAGYERKKAVLMGGGSGLLLLTTIEVFDAYSAEWGFSWGDMIANSSGVALLIGQELLFDRQIVRLKYSYQNTKYSALRPEIFGSSTLESAFKDYNGQTYWASLNLNAVYKPFPVKWLNVAFGYGGDGMLFGEIDSEFNERVFRQYYLSLDIDFEQFPTNKPWKKMAAKVLNCIKVPLPTMEWSNANSPRFHFIYF
jgi:hypothetical protein